MEQVWFALSGGGPCRWEFADSKISPHRKSKFLEEVDISVSLRTRFQSDDNLVFILLHEARHPYRWVDSGGKSAEDSKASQPSTQ